MSNCRNFVTVTALLPSPDNHISHMMWKGNESKYYNIIFLRRLQQAVPTTFCVRILTVSPYERVRRCPAKPFHATVRVLNSNRNIKFLEKNPNVDPNGKLFLRLFSLGRPHVAKTAVSDTWCRPTESITRTISPISWGTLQELLNKKSSVVQ